MADSALPYGIIEFHTGHVTHVISRDKRQCFADSSECFFHYTCSQCNASTLRLLRADPKLHWWQVSCRNGIQSVPQAEGLPGQLKQTDAAYVMHKVRRQKLFFISVGAAEITLEYHQPTPVRVNASFIVRAIKQINYLEMVIVHASPVESLCKHHCGSLAVPGSLVSNTSPVPPSPCGKGNLSPFDASAPAEVSRHAMRQGVCSLPWCLTEPCSIWIVLPHG